MQVVSLIGKILRYYKLRYDIDFMLSKDILNERIKCCILIDYIYRTKIFNECSPFDLLIWRRVCRQFNDVICDRLSGILYLEVYRFNSHMLKKSQLHNEGRSFKLVFPIDTLCWTQ